MKKSALVALSMFFAALLGLSFVLPYWNVFRSATDLTTNYHILDSFTGIPEAFKLYNKTFNATVANMAGYLMIGAFVLLLVYVIVYLVDGKGSMKFVRFIIGVLALACSVVAIVMGIVFISVNQAKTSISTTTISSITGNLGLGMYLAMISSLFGSLSATFAALGKKGK